MVTDDRVVITLNERGFNCRTCTIEFGASMALCTQCYINEDETHKAKHTFETIDFVFDPNGGDSLDELKKSVWRCPACPGTGQFHNFISLSCFIAVLTANSHPRWQGVYASAHCVADMVQPSTH